MFVRGREREGRGEAAGTHLEHPRDAETCRGFAWLTLILLFSLSCSLTRTHVLAPSPSLSLSCTPHWPQCDLFISFNRIKILLSNSNGFKSCNVLRYQLNPPSTHEYSLHSLALSHSASPCLALSCLALSCLGFVWVVWLGPNIAGTNLIVVL